MERAKSPPSDPNTTAASSPPPQAPPLPAPDHRYQDFAANFTSMYHSLFPPKSPPPPLSSSLSPSTGASSASSSADHYCGAAYATERRLNQARLILEYHQLQDHYDLCLTRLQSLTNELELVRRENDDLRLANTELVKLLGRFSSQAAPVRSNPFNRTGDDFADFSFSPRSVIEPKRFERTGNGYSERTSLPKSISIRSSGYLKTNPVGAIAYVGGAASGTSRLPSQQRVSIPLATGSVQLQQQRVYVSTAGGGENSNKQKNVTNDEDEEALELEVYNQGMWKTELCNKWQESGTCPYGEHCQFAHGITELRPVIRHPRYKTQLCRMILSGDTCPYGHRCHFRHSLTEQERSLLVGSR